jgi:hypothetical protein
VRFDISSIFWAQSHGKEILASGDNIFLLKKLNATMEELRKKARLPDFK